MSKHSIAMAVVEQAKRVLVAFDSCLEKNLIRSSIIIHSL